mmetsp:Transcript_5003/g.8231  ORF Transcript_5003/g.8231 Transcript_5003/m.8231 type:complete len:151 (-) Transcript_5003:146-598(-)
MAYANLNDDFGGSETSAMVTIATDDTSVLFRSKVFTKFCTLGFVAMGSWDMTYLVVFKNAVRLYDAEDSFVSDPSSHVLEIAITSQSFTSQITEKDYSKDKFNPIMLKSCYVLKDNGMWAPTKQLKVGTPDDHTLKRLISAIALAKRGGR